MASSGRPVSFAAGLGAAMGAALLSVGLLARPRSLRTVPADDGDAERTLPPASHEERDIGLWPLAAGGLCILVLVAGAMGLASWLYPGTVTDRVVSLPLPAFPAPRLQTSPPQDMASMRADQLRQLGGVYWVDRERNVAHMPIEDAMRDVARAGIPDWPTTPRVQR